MDGFLSLQGNPFSKALEASLNGAGSLGLAASYESSVIPNHPVDPPYTIMFLAGGFSLLFITIGTNKVRNYRINKRVLGFKHDKSIKMSKKMPGLKEKIDKRQKDLDSLSKTTLKGFNQTSENEFTLRRRIK